MRIRATYLTHRRAVIVNHSSMFVALLLQRGLHAVVAVLHALGETLLDLPIMKLHLLLPLQLSVETANVLRAGVSSVQQLDERDRVSIVFMYAYIISASPNDTHYLIPSITDLVSSAVELNLITLEL